jgi:hypothetical protein
VPTTYTWISPPNFLLKKITMALAIYILVDQYFFLLYVNHPLKNRIVQNSLFFLFTLFVGLLFTLLNMLYILPQTKKKFYICKSMEFLLWVWFVQAIKYTFIEPTHCKRLFSFLLNASTTIVFNPTSTTSTMVGIMEYQPWY